MELPPPLAETIAARLGVRACPSEPLARHTSFRIGGPADLLVVPETVDELAFVLRAAAARGARLPLPGYGAAAALRGDGGALRAPRRGTGRRPWPAGRRSAAARGEPAARPRQRGLDVQESRRRPCRPADRCRGTEGGPH